MNAKQKQEVATAVLCVRVPLPFCITATVLYSESMFRLMFRANASL
jgi:hypothetical protein